MQGPDYIFALQDSQFRFWQVDSVGNVSCSNQPYFLETAPIGWESIKIQNIRNKQYWGLNRSISASLNYVEDGARILKHILYTKGIEEQVYLVVGQQKLDFKAGVSYKYYYKRIYRSEIDLTLFMHDGTKVLAPTIEEGLLKYLKANENTLYEFPFQVPEAINVKMDGIPLHEKLNYGVVSDLVLSVNDNAGHNFVMPIEQLSNEGDSTGVVYQSQTLQVIQSLTYAQKLALTNNMMTNVSNPLGVDAHIEGLLQFACSSMSSLPPFGFRIRCLRSNLPIGNQNDYQIFYVGSLTVNQFYSQAVDIHIPLQVGESLLIEGIFFNGPGTDAKIIFANTSLLTVKFSTRYPESYIKAFRQQYIFDQLIRKMTAGKYTAAASAYLKQHEDKVLTSGLALRGLEDATLKISFKDLFKHLDSFDAVGLNEYTNTVDIDTKEKMVDATTYIDLPAPANFKVNIAKEFLFNEMEFGYPEAKNELGALNGSQEYNCKMLFSMGVTKAPAKLDKISPFVTGAFEIEKLRTTTLDKNNSDYKNDNDVFPLHIEDTITLGNGDDIPDHYKLDKVLNATITGVDEPNFVYNIEFSPKRNIGRNESYLHSSTYKMDNKVLAFISADRSDKMTCNGIIEKADVPIASLKNAFFNPIVLQGDFPPPENLLELLDINPLQVIRFPLEGNYYYGVITNISIEPSEKKEQQIQMLSLPQNDLTKLIKYFG